MYSIRSHKAHNAYSRKKIMNNSKKGLIDYISRNFAFFTAITTVLTACITMIFLYSYLLVFDASLIWIVEYQDIIKLCLVGFALMSAPLVFVYNAMDDIRHWVKNDWRQQRKFLIITFILFTAGLVVSLYDDVFVSKKPAKEYHILSYISTFLIIGGLYTLFARYSEILKMKISRIIEIASVMIFIGAFVFGRTYGLLVRDNSSESHSITINGEREVRDTYDDAKIIFVTSHHTIIRAGGSIIAIPSSDVVKIVSQPGGAPESRQ